MPTNIDIFVKPIDFIHMNIANVIISNSLSSIENVKILPRDLVKDVMSYYHHILWSPLICKESLHLEHNNEENRQKPDISTLLVYTNCGLRAICLFRGC